MVRTVPIKFLEGSEMLPVESHRFQKLSRGEMTGEGVGQAHLSGDQGAVGARAKDPEGDIHAFPGYGPYTGTVAVGGKEMLQFLNVAGKIVRFVKVRTADLQGCRLVRAGCASQAKVDPSGIQGCQGAELFGDDEGCVVGEHDPAGADPDRGCSAGNIADQDRGGRTGYVGDVVVFGEPVAFVSPFFYMTGKVEASWKSIHR
jgi:hypothetical protein